MDVIWNISPGQTNKLGDKHPGFCAGLTILWILLRKHNSDLQIRQVVGRYKTDDNAVLTPTQLNQIQKYQDDRISKGEASYFDLLNAKIDKTFTAKAVNGAYDVNDLKEIAEIVSTKTDRFRSTMIGGQPTCFFLVRFSKGDKVSGQSGHVAAIEVKGVTGQQQTIRFTDIMGVAGCLQFNGKDEFASWLEDPFQAFGGHPMLYTYKIRIQQVIYADPSATELPGLIWDSLIDKFW
jgi:hypothetical protein